MSSDTPPPQKLHQQHLNPNSPLPGASAVHSMPASEHSSRPGSADPAAVQGPATGNELQSQPMTATSSTDAVGTDSATPSGKQTTYGTRSRGRNAPRPNYAEDRDIDMDLEFANPKTAKRSSGSAFNNAVNGSSKPEGEKSSSNSRKSHPTANGTNPTNKESIPGTSTFSAKADDGSGSSTASKKRKQPASTPNSSSVNGSVAKKIFTAAPSLAQETETNMATFDTHGRHLKDGKLKADDGTVYAPNGSLPPDSSIVLVVSLLFPYSFFFSSTILFVLPHLLTPCQITFILFANHPVSRITWRASWSFSHPRNPGLARLRP